MPEDRPWIVTTLNLPHNESWTLIDGELALSAYKREFENGTDLHIKLRRGLDVAAGKDADKKGLNPTTSEIDISKMVLKINGNRPLIRIGGDYEIHFIASIEQATKIVFLSHSQPAIETHTAKSPIAEIIKNNLSTRRMQS